MGWRASVALCVEVSEVEQSGFLIEVAESGWVLEWIWVD
jgi:hypothetical protein